jgi:hypothetical protein
VQRSHPGIQEWEPRCCVKIQDGASAAAERLEKAFVQWYRNSNGNNDVRRQMERAMIHAGRTLLHVGLDPALVVDSPRASLKQRL